MSVVNDSISRVRSLLLSPRDQKPSTDQLFTSLTYEFQNFYNELSSSNLPWNVSEQTVTVISGTTDYLVTNPTGKVLFVIAYPQDTNYGAVSLEFADLADVSSDFYLYSPLDWGFSRDFNESINFPFPAQIAFYRKDNDLWFRLAPFAYALTSVKIIYSTGDWLANLQTTDTAVLSQHHGLPEVRTALNLLAGAEWMDNEDANQLKRVNLDRSLSRAEARYAQQFMYGKRALTADHVTVRESW